MAKQNVAYKMVESEVFKGADEIKNSIKQGLKLINSKRTIKNEEELPYPMDTSYGEKDWNITSALREIIANAIDTGSEYKIDYVSGFAVIRDKGAGLTKQSFIFGKSTKRESDSKVGQFGEGTKMSFLTLLRLERIVWVNTVGFTTLVDKVPSEKYGAELMKLRFLPNDRKEGTDIFIECSEQELEEAKRLFLELSPLEKIDNNIFKPANSIFIVGLKTTTLTNTLFSYNIEDKTMTNRDRNIVDVVKLQSSVMNILKKAKNQAFIKEYLTAFKDNSNAFEYQLPFIPDESKKDTWVKVLKKVLPKAVLSSDMQSDLYASMMGYTVLRNVPSNLHRVFKYLGVSESSVYARNYNGEGLKIDKKIIFPISEGYVGQWTRKDAIKEFLANSLDAGDKISVTCSDGKVRISDNGVGIAKKHFVFGVSEKNDTAIGKWGEGMKIACLVLARTQSPVKIETVGYTYEAKLEKNDDFGMKLLVVYYTKNLRTKGTSIVFNATEKEIEEAKGMFIQFKGVRNKKISTDIMDVYFENPGVVYSNGLETTKINALFSYNIKNKEIVSSRDRNAVDTYKLQEYIEKFLSASTDETIIDKFLSGWQNDRGLIEYRAQFQPKSEEVWIKIAKKTFNKACFAIDGYDNEDFIAKQAGYTILREVPYSVRRVLERAGIKRADIIAKKYKNKGILLGDRIVYPITKEYVSNMSIDDAIKELISNCLDTESKTSISCGDGIISISDKGEGISKKNLLFSESNKTESQIGQFCEGLKFASLVLARNNREFKISTKGYDYVATIERDTQFKADVLVITLSANRKRVGTDITFKGTQQELNRAKNNFLAFNESFKRVDCGIYSPGGNIFVNGVFIQKINSIYSYDIIGAKDIVSRERKTIDFEKAKISISSLVSISDNKKFIEHFITNKQYDKIEHQLSVNPLNKAVWKEVIGTVYAKHCFATGSDYDGVAMDKGYKLILQTSITMQALLSRFGVMASNQVVTLKGDEKQIRKRFDKKKLSDKGKKRYDKSIELFTELYGARLAKKIELVETFNDGVETDSTWGLYNSTTDTIYVLAEIVDKTDKYDFDEYMGVLIHEQIHRKSGAHDRTREFEFALSMELGRIASLYFKSVSKSNKSLIA
ncbi:MAG: hypothetical protein K0R54_819 [Clostridiaceae bacterium]|jgi:hypothetical protein|nr:hypothetical protein [Clostridiaceae bacterium]